MAASTPFSLALLFVLIAPVPLLGVGVADPSYKEHSYSCADYTPLAPNSGNIVEFRCKDGKCIEIEGKCNGVRNCEDGSDEAAELCPATAAPATTEAPPPKPKATPPPMKKTDVREVLATLQAQEAVVEQKMAKKKVKDDTEVEKQEEKKVENTDEKKDEKKQDEKKDETNDEKKEETKVEKKEITSEQKAVAAMEKEAKSHAEEEAEAEAAAEAKAREEVLAASEATIEATAPPCQTSVEGEVCYQKVMWAKTQGVKEHPEWYNGLTADSSFEAFQAALHLGHYGHCAVPCNFKMPTTVTTTATQTSTTTTTLSPAALLNKTMSCSTVGVFLPLDMPHTSMSTVDNITACQERCARTEGCAHYSFYKPLRNCHMQSKYAKLVTSNVLFLSGPPTCHQKKDKEVEDESEMEFRKLFLSRHRSDTTGSLMPAAAALLAFVAALCGVAAVAGLAWRRSSGFQNGELYATLQHGSSSNLQQEGEIAE